MLTVRMSVRALIFFHVDRPNIEIVMSVVTVKRGDLTEEPAHVFEEFGLGFIDLNSSSGMNGKDTNNPVSYACTADSIRHIVGYIDELRGVACEVRECLGADAKAG